MSIGRGAIKAKCLIGCRRAISDASVEIERAAVKLSSILRTETVKELKHTVGDYPRKTYEERETEWALGW